jgi:hypothetical protein
MKSETHKWFKRLQNKAVAAVVAVGILATLPGCGDDDNPLAPELPQGPKTSEVTVTIGSVVVMAACEGSTSNPGEFTWELVVKEPGVHSTDRLRFAGTFGGVSGQTVDIPDVTFTMEREPKSGDYFTMEFHVTEWDGSAYDSRMRDSIGDKSHRWKSDTGWGDGAHTVLVPGATECRVNFVYSIEVD